MRSPDPGWLRRTVLVTVSVSVLVGLAAPVLHPLEERVADTWRSAARRDIPDVLIVAVDDESLRRIPDPLAFWAPHFGRAVARLQAAGATVVGLDFSFQVSAEGWLQANGLDGTPASRTWDTPLKAALAGGGVVLAASASPELVLPLAPYVALLSDPAASIGLTDLTVDADGVVRRYRPVLATGTPALGFALATVLRHRQLPADADSWRLGAPVDRSGAAQEILWYGPGGTTDRLPFWRVAQAQLSDTEIAQIGGRIVLIGATFTGSQDRFETPHGGMDGVEVHATLAQGLLDGRSVRPCGPVIDAILVGLTTLSMALVAFRSSLRATLLVGAGVLLGWPVLAAVSFRAGVHVPTAAGILATILVFLVAWPMRFAAEQAGRRTLHALFRRTVAPEVLDALLRAPGGIALGGARREISVLVVDICGFTTLSEQLAPEEVVELLNRWFERACAPVLDNGGIVDKFVGDGILAVFGAPVVRADHARRAVVTAVAIAEASRAFAPWVAERFAGRGLLPFAVGVGVHTGDAVAGNIGFALRSEYTVVGDTVNTASRIEGLTRSVGCTVLISAATLAACGPGVQTGRRASLPVRGKAQAVEVHEVLGWA